MKPSFYTLLIGSTFYLTILIITNSLHKLNEPSNVTVIFIVYLSYTENIACMIFGMIFIVSILQMILTFYVALDILCSFMDEITRKSLSSKMERVL